MKFFHNALLVCAGLFVYATAFAEVSKVDITQRSDVLNGRVYGNAGVYEWVHGRAHFTLDPTHARNKTVVDIELAPKNAKGLVEYSADLIILRPKDAAKANGVVVFDVVNRGRETILEYLNRGNRTAKHGTDEFVGDDFLLNQGVTLVWLGWQQDLPDGMNLLRMSGPVIESLSSLVYGDAVVTSKVNEISLGDRLSIPYAVSDLKSPQAWLAVAASRAAPEQRVPREQWSFARIKDGALVDSPSHIHLKSGFEPGAYYRFAYPTKDSQLAGLSLTGIPTLIPPKAGKPYATHVPQVDDDGNDAGGIRMPELVVPLATYTGWNLRHPSTGAPVDLVQLTGAYLPFTRTRAEREKANDARLSIAERYTSRDEFLARVEKASRELIAKRLLLTDDVKHVMQRAQDHWALVHSDGVK